MRGHGLDRSELAAINVAAEQDSVEVSLGLNARKQNDFAFPVMRDFDSVQFVIGFTQSLIVFGYGHNSESE